MNHIYIETWREWNLHSEIFFKLLLFLSLKSWPLIIQQINNFLFGLVAIALWVGNTDFSNHMGDVKSWDNASKPWFSSSFVGLLSRKAGLIGVVTNSILNVNNATISDMGGLKCASGWRHKKATWIACITSFSTNPCSRSTGSTMSNIRAFSYNFHAYIMKLVNIHYKL